MSTDITRHYWTNGTQSLNLEANESNTQDVNTTLPNLIPTETLVFSLCLSKFADSLFTYLKGRNLCDHKLLRNKLLRNFCDFGPK